MKIETIELIAIFLSLLPMIAMLVVVLVSEYKDRCKRNQSRYNSGDPHPLYPQYHYCGKSAGGLNIWETDDIIMNNLYPVSYPVEEIFNIKCKNEKMDNKEEREIQSNLEFFDWPKTYGDIRSGHYVVIPIESPHYKDNKIAGINSCPKPIRREWNAHILTPHCSELLDDSTQKENAKDE